jgi:hypothetical protein
MTEPDIELVIAAIAEVIDEFYDQDPEGDVDDDEVIDAVRARFPGGISNDLLLRAAMERAYRLGTLPRGYAGSVTQSSTA